MDSQSGSTNGETSARLHGTANVLLRIARYELRRTLETAQMTVSPHEAAADIACVTFKG